MTTISDRVEHWAYEVESPLLAPHEITAMAGEQATMTESFVDGATPADEWTNELEFLDEDYEKQLDEDYEEQLDDAEEYESELGYESNAETFSFLDEELESATDEVEEFETAPYGEEESSTLDTLLESEAESPGLASRLRGVAAFALGPTLQRGSSGVAVAALQRALTSLGHPLKDDGDFGPRTEAAVRAFEARRGLTVDGIVDGATRAAIASALATLGQSTGPAPIVGPAPQPGAQALCTSVAVVAEAEFRRWRPEGAALSETDAAATPILQDYYRTGVGVEVTPQQLQSGAYQNNHPWSAVFISWVMRTAGLNTFPVARAHQAYIRAARRARLDSDGAVPYWAYRATEIAPQVGDLVCKSRAVSGATYDNIGDSTLRPTHCDVVIEIRPGLIRTIGGNVNQRVDARDLRTQADGRLDLTGNQNVFFAVMRCRAGGAVPAPPPVPVPPPGNLGNSLESRILQVMELLVNTYGYPVNGAAGIVGNLMSESSVIPNRIEGSRPDTPMHARDFTNQMRTFTPEEVRDRSSRRGRGPLKPGIGIAQWTSSARRQGLFQHVFQGRRLGAGILFDLPAQVDYLVTELRRRTSINAILCSPAVTVNDAADEVVYRFEVPGSVLEPVPTPKPPNFRRRLLPRADQRVQNVFARRRQNAQQALRVYRARHP